MSNSQQHITIIDVSPRDGLQNEPEILPVATKVALVRRLVEAGVPWVEVGAFVNPRQVPQQAGTTEVAMALTDDETARFTCLIPNMRGYELAAAAGMRHVRLVLAASESLNQANFKRSVNDSLEDFAHIVAQAARDGVAFGVAIGASFGCPFEGAVAPARVLNLVCKAVDLGATEIILADTTGMGAPTQVARICGEALSLLKQQADLTVHFHNTRNTGYANAFAAWQVGVRRFDASLGGIGGCPFAPRAVGNIATEDLVHMFYGMGVCTGIDLGKLLDASNWLAAQLGRPLPALVGKAGPVYHTC
ncbi:MAG: hydroxymethylglutaryl-CoA lyase [Roseiflexus sp.]|uniref:hydroxymethylglutaryl-CoA lyase n=1 Tax=Roseiflexus sp. TaxID=2562120 RepID=UPI0025D91013|nr:hydroxymethylglutaryl-CoA lyase [Roseiflexus sp.]MCL6539599.1 hydroxymethylglutaryl-CoA lyase [Roseiflexus sp.]